MAESNKPSVAEEIDEMNEQDTQQTTGDLTKQDKKASTKKAKKKKKKDTKGTGLVPASDGRTTTTVPKDDGPEEVLTARNLQEMLAKLSIQEKNKPHEFWDTQPVPKLDEKVKDVGPIEVDKEDSIRQEPFTLPPLFVWDEIDLTNKDQLQELYTLLNENYVEDDDHLFRFDYTPEFLQWALQPPGWKKVWHCGVRVASNKKLVGFISAVPARIRIRDHEQLMVEINFLCVHKKLRTKRVAPVLIKEITRRVNMEGIFQAVYTAGVVLPKPVAVCRYWHRSLNPKKLVEVQFSSLHRHMTLQRMMRIYRIPDETKVAGLRLMEPRDAPSLLRLLDQELRKYDLAPNFHTEAEILHWFLPMPNIVTTYVYEDPSTHDVTDMVSFYHLSSTVVQHPVHKLLRAAYLFYCASTHIPMKDLIYDALVYAKRLGTDVFNALNIMGNLPILEELKFGVGDGNLHYYLYNWKCPEIEADKVGLVLQ